MKSSKIHNLRAPEKFVQRYYSEDFSPEPYRTDFGRDRDRILYSKAFRRLKGKTQVFLSKGSDHLRTRLTHTLEVSQIARTIANNLRLDETLTEAIALGHDLGHTPFGHVGERTLNQIMNNCDQLGDFQNEMLENDKGFKHNWQGLRVVCELEKIYGKIGLNLTNFTLWGIVNHSSLKSKACEYYLEKDNFDCFLQRNPRNCSNSPEEGRNFGFYSKYIPFIKIENASEAWSFEGYVVALADEIAQRHHDTEDAINLGIISQNELVERLDNNFSIYYSGNTQNAQVCRLLLTKLKNSTDSQEFMPYLSKFIVNFYTNNLIEATKENLSKFIQSNHIFTRRSFILNYPTLPLNEVSEVVSFCPGFMEKDEEFQKFLKNRILNSHIAQQMDGKGRFIIRRLFKAYLTNPRQLFDSTVISVFKNYGGQFTSSDDLDLQKIGFLREKIDSAKNKSNPKFQIALLRAICDNISGMTDEFAINQYKQLYE